MTDKRNSKTVTTNEYQNIKYFYIAAAIATAIAGIIHLYMPLIAHQGMLERPQIAAFFLGSGIAQVFWILPMIKRWGPIWYYIGIIGNLAFIILYVITRFPHNPINGRGGDIDIVDMICEVAQAAYIGITAMILVKEKKVKLNSVR